jgi:UDP-GlcNAc:undecaprenyl-phosphate GlcNAc-1-phosphate transferase
MAGLAVALRIVSHHHRNQAGWIAGLLVLAVICAAASVYLVYVLEIFKFKGLRTIELRRADPDTTEHEIDDQVAKDIETGEFERVK